MKYILAVIISLWSMQSIAAPRFGRYIGVLRHQNSPHDQLARLDFVTEQETGGVIKLKATLVLFFGDFSSDEYASYDYDHVTYNLLNGSLIFDSTERELHFVVNKFGADGLNAEVRTGNGVVGNLILKQVDQVAVERPLVQPVWGEYRGVCNGVGQRLQIQSSSSHPIATNRTDPFAPFVILAQRGDNGGGACPIDASTCVTDVYYDADYDFFNSHIDFHGTYGALSCHIDDSGLTCGECRYTRTSGEKVLPGIKSVPMSEPNWKLNLNPDASAAGIQGVYTGYVHLEGRDTYQVMSIGITTYRQNTGGSGSSESLMISLISSLKFGGHTGNDQSINTKFDPRPLNIMNAQPLFDRLDHTSDMILKLNRIGGGIIEGTWFSRRFGRVGTFLLSSAGTVELLAPEKLDSKLAGTFNDGYWNVSINVAMSDQSISSKDPFSPLTILGNMWLTNITARRAFTNSAFDPFTGKFLLEIDNGAIIIGKRTASGLKIKTSNGGIMRPMQPHKFIELSEVLP